MRLTILRHSNSVGINGRFLSVNCRELPGNLRAVQWDGAIGWEEWDDADNTELVIIDKYKNIIDAWEAVNKAFLRKQQEELDRANDPFYGLTPEETLVKREQLIRAKYAQRMRNVAGNIFLEERESWDTQVKQAEQWQKDPEAPCKMIRKIAERRGITMEIMVAKILNSEDKYSEAIGDLLGQQQAEIDLLFPERKEEV